MGNREGLGNKEGMRYREGIKVLRRMARKGAKLTKRIEIETFIEGTMSLVKSPQCFLPKTSTVGCVPFHFDKLSGRVHSTSSVGGFIR